MKGSVLTIDRTHSAVEGKAVKAAICASDIGAYLGKVDLARAFLFWSFGDEIYFTFAGDMTGFEEMFCVREF